MKKYNAVIFDLDGVICHTDKYHYQAWKAVADELGIYFDEEINNRLRGVSRMESFEIILERYEGEMSEEEKERLVKNPLRILDTKNQALQDVLDGAPKLLDYLDDESREHFAQLCGLLDAVGIQYEINPKLVRGLDYYNKTVFEWVTSALGAQGTVCGGGRYDGLVEQLGGHATSGVGFAMGLERLVLLVQEVNKSIPVKSAVDIYVVYQGEGTTLAAFQLAEKLRSELPHLSTMLHCSGGNFKKQFKRADKSGATLALVLGESEVQNNQVVVKHLLGAAEQQTIDVSNLIEHVKAQF